MIYRPHSGAVNFYRKDAESDVPEFGEMPMEAL